MRRNMTLQNPGQSARAVNESRAAALAGGQAPAGADQEVAAGQGLAGAGSEGQAFQASLTAEVGANISRIPGPPQGPS